MESDMENLNVCNLVVEYIGRTGELMKGTLLEEDRTDAGGFVVVDRDNFRRKLSDQGEWLWLWPGPGEPEIVVPAWRMVSATLVRCGLGRTAALVGKARPVRL